MGNICDSLVFRCGLTELRFIGKRNRTISDSYIPSGGASDRYAARGRGDVRLPLTLISNCKEQWRTGTPKTRVGISPHMEPVGGR